MSHTCLRGIRKSWVWGIDKGERVKYESYKQYKKKLKDRKKKKQIKKTAEDSWKIDQQFRETLKNL